MKTGCTRWFSTNGRSSTCTTVATWIRSTIASPTGKGVELVQAYDEKTVNQLWGRFSGGDFTAAKGYRGPGEGVGNRIVPATFYGPGRDFDERPSAWKRADAWMTFLGQKLAQGDHLRLHAGRAEPGPVPEDQEARREHPLQPGARQAVAGVRDHEFTPELDGAIDIWCSGPQGYFIQKALEVRAKGGDYWVYNGGRPYGGAIVIDAPATDARATIWACFKHDIKVYFYWHGNHWRHNTQKTGNRNQNVWAEPVTFDNRGQPNKPIEDQSFANGDGVLMYPGEEKLHPAEDRGIPGPCSTVQLANFRRGLQDHLYLTMARQLGLSDLVGEAVQAVVPRVFSDAGERVGFSENGDDYEKMRLRLGEAIEGASKRAR